MLEQANREGIASIAMPRIGAGYGGLSWRKVRDIVESVFADWQGTLYVYEDYAPEAGKVKCDTMVVIESRGRRRANVEKAWPGALIVDVTSKGSDPWLRFSPFFPHGGVPVPNSPGIFSQSVEGIWQGLRFSKSRTLILPGFWSQTCVESNVVASSGGECWATALASGATWFLATARPGSKSTCQRTCGC